MNNAKKILEDYLKFSGVRSADEIQKLLNRANETKANPGSPEFFKLAHIRQQLTRAYFAAQSEHNKMIELEIETGTLFKYEDQQLGKFRDTGEVPKGGRQDEYWNHNRPEIQFKPSNTAIRKGSPLPTSFNLDSERFLLNYFATRAVEYGQWLTQQDRVNYLAGWGLAMYDLHKILGFQPQQIGLFGLLSVAFGARGRGKALGHFEPNTYAINLTRFKRPAKFDYRPNDYDRSELLFFSGGIGTFCHEFGHALDYYAGMFVEPAPHTVNDKELKYWISLSFHKSNRTKPIAELIRKNTLRGLMEKLLFKIIWKRSGEYTEYYKRVIELAEKHSKNSGYWSQRNELFARAFEVYVINKMKQKGWFNIFLHHQKYESPMYLTTAEFKTVEREFDDLIRAMRYVIRANTGSLIKLSAVMKRLSDSRRKKSKK